MDKQTDNRSGWAQKGMNKEMWNQFDSIQLQYKHNNFNEFSSNATTINHLKLNLIQSNLIKFVRISMLMKNQ